MTNNKKVMDRVETLNHIKSKMCNERSVISRYSDGEYLMMNKQQNNTYDSFNILPELLMKAIKVKNQLVCINYLKPHNIERRDGWYYTQKYLRKAGSQDLYGCCNWNTYDFQNKNEVLPFLFSKNTLLVTGHVEESELAFGKIQPNLKVYPMPKRNASDIYRETKIELEVLCNEFDNIIFACGPIGKALLTDLIDVCDSNLVDIGALLNAIVNEYSHDKSLVGQWSMSWIKNVDIKEQAMKFFEKLEELK